MSKTIACIPADNVGNLLYLKDVRINNKKIFVKYKSTYNDIPFREAEIYSSDANTNFTINGDDGTVLYRFAQSWIVYLLESNS